MDKTTKKQWNSNKQCRRCLNATKTPTKFGFVDDAERVEIKDMTNKIMQWRSTNIWSTILRFGDGTNHNKSEVARYWFWLIDRWQRKVSMLLFGTHSRYNLLIENITKKYSYTDDLSRYSSVSFSSQQSQVNWLTWNDQAETLF